MGPINYLVTDILQNIFFRVQQGKEIHTDLDHANDDRTFFFGRTMPLNAAIELSLNNLKKSSLPKINIYLTSTIILFQKGIQNPVLLKENKLIKRLNPMYGNNSITRDL